MSPTEGERWSRAQLEALRRERWTPRALAAFLAASQRRANLERAARPDDARRMRGWGLAGTAAHVGLALAGGPAGRRALPGALAWWAACGLMLDWHLGMLETADGRARPLGPADAVTLARAWAVPVAARGAGPGLCLAAWASDGLDGHLARRGEPTRLGRDLEGLVDACFTAAALRGARRADALPAWAVAGEGARLAAGVGHAAWVFLGRARAPDPALARAGRLSSPLRVAGLAAAGAGRRGTGGVLLAAGSAWGLAAVAGAARGS